MTLIRIQERPNGPNGANAIVDFNNSGAEYPITISDPFSPEEEKLLEWYFEEHLQFPFLEQVKAQQVAASIITYGEKLFQQIVGDQPKAYLTYMNARQQGVNTLQLEIAGSPKFHSLHKAHFEALAEAARYTPPEPQYGFVGRDLDILQLEKRLLTQRNIVLVLGMGGAGKTTLLHHLSSWWRTTGFVQQVFYFGYDEQAYNRQQIMVAIAQRVLGQVKYPPTSNL